MAREKKDPQDLTVEEKLKTLYQLQTTLSKIDEIKTLRGELPLEVELQLGMALCHRTGLQALPQCGDGPHLSPSL